MPKFGRESGHHNVQRWCTPLPYDPKILRAKGQRQIKAEAKAEVGLFEGPWKALPLLVDLKVDAPSSHTQLLLFLQRLLEMSAYRVPKLNPHALSYVCFSFSIHPSWLLERHWQSCCSPDRWLRPKDSRKLPKTCQCHQQMLPGCERKEDGPFRHPTWWLVRCSS